MIDDPWKAINKFIVCLHSAYTAAPAKIQKKKSGSKLLEPLSKNGGPEWNRTTDTAIFSRVLYQLSYQATRGVI